VLVLVDGMAQGSHPGEWWQRRLGDQSCEAQVSETSSGAAAWGPDPTKVSENSARAERRVRSLLRWVHGGAEEDSHITQRNID